MDKRSYQWSYKDSHRYWWEIKAVETSADEEHTYWDVEIARDGDLIYEDVEESQYTEPISLLNILSSWMLYQNNVYLGMAKYAVLEETK